MLFGMNTPVGPRNIVLDGNPDTFIERERLGKFLGPPSYLSNG